MLCIYTRQCVHTANQYIKLYLLETIMKMFLPACSNRSY